MGGTIPFRQPPVSHESPVQRWIRWIFWASVALWIARWAIELVGAAADPVAFDESLRPYTGRVLGWLLGAIVAPATLWFLVYRHGGFEARVWAGIAGAALVLLVLIDLARASIDVPVDAGIVVQTAGTALAHFAYAFLGSRVRW